MVILSPCAIELTTYYSGIIAGWISSSALAERGARMPAAVGRIIRNLVGFVAVTVLYMASGATVGLLGQQLLAMQAKLGSAANLEEVFAHPARDGRRGGFLHRQRENRHANHAPALGNGRAMPIGWARVFVLRVEIRGAVQARSQCFVWLGRLASVPPSPRGRCGIGFPRRAQFLRAGGRLRTPENITPLNSFCAGLGLSVSCLTSMGGAILYPLLIFVGTRLGIGAR